MNIAEIWGPQKSTLSHSETVYLVLADALVVFRYYLTWLYVFENEFRTLHLRHVLSQECMVTTIYKDLILLFTRRKTTIRPVSQFFFLNVDGLWKESLNREWFTIPLISTKRPITSHLHSLNTKKRHAIWRWKSRSWLGTGTIIWRG
jgi:hypothetical protein